MAYFDDYKRDLDEAVKHMKAGRPEKAETLVRSILKKGISLNILNESSINRLGYDYIERSDLQMAIVVLKANVAAYPLSANVYDSLGEAYLEYGDKDSSVVNYKKALEIEPDNESAIEALKKLK